MITSDIKIIKILSEEERQEILYNKNYSEIEAFKKYKKTFEKRMRIA